MNFVVIVVINVYQIFIIINSIEKMVTIKCLLLNWLLLIFLFECVLIVLKKNFIKLLKQFIIINSMKHFLSTSLSNNLLQTSLFLISCYEVYTIRHFCKNIKVETKGGIFLEWIRDGEFCLIKK